jgi:hypothetical protein
MLSRHSPPNCRPTVQSDTQHWVLLALIILGGALLRLLLLTNQSLWFDEGQSLVVTDSGTLAGTIHELSVRAGGDKYQPLYFLVLSMWRSLMGDSEFSLRLLSVVPGVFALIFVHGAVANIFGRRHALLATMYLAFSAFWICYSQEVRPYSLLFCLSTIQLFLLSSVFSHTEKPHTTRILLFALATGVSAFASILLAAFTVSLALAHMSITRSPTDWLKWWVPAVIACVPAGIYFLGTPAVGQLAMDSTNGLGLPLYKNSLFALYGILVGHTFGPPLDALRESGQLTNTLINYAWQLTALAIAMLLLGGGFLRSQFIVFKNSSSLQGDKNQRFVSGNRFFLALLVFSSLMAALVAKVSGINWMPRHSFYLAIPVAILLPIAFTISVNQHKIAMHGIRKSAQLAFIALLALNIYASYNYFYKSEYARDDYRAAAGYLINNMTETDRAIMLWGEPRLLSYYGETSTQNRWQENPPPVSTVMDGVYSEGGKVFVAINREFTWSRGMPTSDNLETQVASKYNLISVKRYVNFNIYEFETNEASDDTILPLTSAEDLTLQAM